ncbi:methyltransferase domain-containing protein [Clostridium botulinum]|uniref:MerR family transcriptional regulator n=1 Tax=unclassified Clostridium TaxID=2614128 RepID=UPI0013CCEFF3|nr:MULTISPECIES: methyltransferase domain-containing protein [unclassified Clostridium]MBY7007111.1 methyltransferase domain-containing protein [Clostridium botulinum]NFF24399.1 methyltransferase domain-containing protein [Clostridium botulinum]NFH72305.1 methyltransferase domain-containing protein [Clostridium botulinum]NFI01660.1 methyltransferase domain-containing protein [Clostridium botulinum]NFI49870.1 methyltransferase domain-containing protein [Clostridium botulinum]
MKIGEFAKRSGVTVKTLLHYDKIGLLKPSEKTEVGYRIYCEDDFLRLQQITTLKFIGISLSYIAHILNESGENLESMVKIQKRALEEKKRHIDAVIEIFNNAENTAKQKGFLDVNNLVNIIKITNMQNSIKEQYNSDENLNLRTNLHSYNINKIDWDKWCFQKMNLIKCSKILELGCGVGKLWIKNQDFIDENSEIILSDFSPNMLKCAKNNLENLDCKFKYKKINAEDIPYDDESFDVVIAEHMLYFVTDIEKALSEIKRVLKPNGIFYVTTNSCNSMIELNKLAEKFDPNLDINNNGLSSRFDLENGEKMLKKYFNNIESEILEGKIILDKAEPVVSYKASTIQGNSILVGKKREEFTKYLEKYIEENKNIEITTKAGIFKASK